MNITVQMRLSVLVLFLMLANGKVFSAKADLLTGTWKVKDLRYQYEIPEELKPSFEKSIDEIKQTFSITYKDDGTYITKVKGQQLGGTWQLNEATSVITARPEGGAEKFFNIIELTEKDFSFTTKEGNSEVTFIMVRDSSNTLYIILVPVIISVLLIAALLFYKRNRFKAKQKPS